MDCEDGSDEEQCGTLTPAIAKTNTSIVTPKNMCPQHYFQCNSGLFVCCCCCFFFLKVVLY